VLGTLNSELVLGILSATSIPESPMLVAVLALAACGTLGAGQAPQWVDSSLARIVDDSAHHRFVITVGPTDLPAHADHHMVREPGVQMVRLPRGGWLQGYLVEIVDSSGRVLPREVIHHVEMIEFDRRDLLGPQVQRMVSVGKETPREMLPSTLGYPVRRGEPIGINAMLHNPTDTAYRGVYAQVTLPYTPEGAPTRPLDIISISTDVTGAVGHSSMYDIPPGPSSVSHEFTVPISGRLLGVGGHLHDFGARLLLVNLSTGDTVYNAVPTVDSAGAILSMPLGNLWLHGGYHIRAGQRFRLTAFYDNTTGQTIPMGAMGTLGGAFNPDPGQKWPALNPDDPGTKADLAYLEALKGMHEMTMP
jgi:hypothetical protein